MSDLNDLVRRVVGWAEGDEQVEAYAAHSRDADVEIYQGDIETLSSAESSVSVNGWQENGVGCSTVSFTR